MANRTYFGYQKKFQNFLLRLTKTRPADLGILPPNDMVHCGVRREGRRGGAGSHSLTIFILLGVVIRLILRLAHICQWGFSQELNPLDGRMVGEERRGLRGAEGPGQGIDGATHHRRIRPEYLWAHAGPVLPAGKDLEPEK